MSILVVVLECVIGIFFKFEIILNLHWIVALIVKWIRCYPVLYKILVFNGYKANVVER